MAVTKVAAAITVTKIPMKLSHLNRRLDKDEEPHGSALQVGHALGDGVSRRGDEVVDDPAVGEEQHAVGAGPRPAGRG